MYSSSGEPSEISDRDLLDVFVLDGRPDRSGTASATPSASFLLMRNVLRFARFAHAIALDRLGEDAVGCPLWLTA
jgi:hypothetical protein